MESTQVVVIGASAGGVEALRTVLGELPADFPAAVCIVLHTPAGGSSNLPTILARAGSLPVEHAQDGQPLEAGRILVAPPDRHLTVFGGHVRVTPGPRENGHRPAIDVLFRSAARAFGGQAIGVVLSGALADGSAGLEAIKDRGGTAIIQDPDDALFPGMPLSAAERVAVDHSLPAPELGRLLTELVATGAGKGGGSVSSQPDHSTTREPTKAEVAEVYLDPPGEPSHFSCPECGGVLWEADAPLDADLRCRVGHAYSFQVLERDQRDRIEAALWTALRGLEENALASGRLAARARNADRAAAARGFASRQAEAERQAAVIRSALFDVDGETPAAG